MKLDSVCSTNHPNGFDNFLKSLRKEYGDSQDNHPDIQSDLETYDETRIYSKERVFARLSQFHIHNLFGRLMLRLTYNIFSPFVKDF